MSTPDSEEWETAVSVKKATGDDWRMNIAIEYKGKTDAELARFALPWEWPQAMTICAVSAAAQRPKPFPILRTGDPPMRPIRVTPGEVLRGEVAPLTLFDNTSEEWRARPVIVFWSFKVKTSNRVGGWFEVGKTEDVNENRTAPRPSRPVSKP
jgi:hypothetical protein